LLMAIVFSCSREDTPVLKCRFKSITEQTSFFLSSLANVQTYSTFTYDASGRFLKQTTNSSSATRTASYTVDIKKLSNTEIIYAYNYGDGSFVNDTMVLDSQGRRKQVRQRVRTNGLQNIFEYSYTPDGYNAEILQRDKQSPQINKYRWILNNGNLETYQQMINGEWASLVQYEYNTLPNDRNYYLGSYYFATVQGRPAKNLVNKITQGSASLTYSNYVLNEHGYVKSYTEDYTAGVEQPFRKQVNIEYECF
jgi:hypothetical protein